MIFLIRKSFSTLFALIQVAFFSNTLIPWSINFLEQGISTRLHSI